MSYRLARLLAAVVLALMPLGGRALRAQSLEAVVAAEHARSGKLASLRQQLLGTDPGAFANALDQLAGSTDPGTLAEWERAVATTNGPAHDAVVRRFIAVRDQLTRRERVAQVARLALSLGALRAVRATLESAGGPLRLTVWQDVGDAVVVAVPAAARERLTAAGVQSEVLFDSVAAWDAARHAGQAAAEHVTPRYQSAAAAQDYLPRVLVIDLAGSQLPARPLTHGATVLIDPENVIARNDRYLAYLDLLPARHRHSYLSRRYRRRGVRVVGVFGLDDFRGAQRQFFPELPQPDATGAAAGYDGQFHSYDEVATELHDLATQYPDIARVVSLGPTYEGREIWALKISRGVAVDDPNKPDVLFTGCHHAREWISVEPPINLAHRLAEHYANNDRIRYLIDHAEIWLVPVVNPDGLTYSQQSPNDGFDSVRYWRKNRQPITTACGSGVGVDLNRNYSFMWRLPSDQPCPNTADDAGASDSPTDFQLYRGPTPVSELEVQALTALTASPAHNFVARVDFHNFGQLVLYPWSFGSSQPADAGTLALLGAKLAQRLGAPNDVPYTPEPGVGLYVATGTSTDSAYGVDHTIGAFTIELRPLNCCFAVPENQIAPINRESWSAARTLMTWTVGPPILTGVTAMQASGGAAFDTTVYQADWTETGGARSLTVSTRAALLQPGALQLSLRFSKPLPKHLVPVVTLGRAAPFTELQAVALGQSEGWQTTTYRYDTWIGEVTIPPGGDGVTSWHLAVSAHDAASLPLDAAPASVAHYGFGSGMWLNDESGADLQHALSPSAG